MKRITLLFAVALAIGCGPKNAVTGRNESILVSEESMQQMAVTEYKTFLTQSKVVSAGSNKDADMVKRVGARIASAINTYYAAKGQADVLKGYQWEYNLVDKNEANAWCMPGGKIVVYTGLLPLTQNENALAVVMGHEVAHALAQHGRERMADEMKRQLLGTALSVAVANKSQETQNAFKSAYDVGSNLVGVLPHSRKQELEADQLGLLYCALAGYDPREAIPFWKRMGAASNGQAPPEFLSTHPNPDNRVQKLQEYMPEALKNYKGKL